MIEKDYTEKPPAEKIEQVDHHGCHSHRTHCNHDTAPIGDLDVHVPEGCGSGARLLAKFAIGREFILADGVEAIRDGYEMDPGSMACCPTHTIGALMTFAFELMVMNGVDLYDATAAIPKPLYKKVTDAAAASLGVQVEKVGATYKITFEQ